MGKTEIEAFLPHLAVQNKVSASTQNQAFNAILFVYRDVLEQAPDCNIQAVCARQPRNLPTVLMPEEVRSIITQKPIAPIWIGIMTKGQLRTI